MSDASIPNDPAILLSYINTQLRDFYPSFAVFCDDKAVDSVEIANKLQAIGYTYDAKRNQFR